ncbi:MAG: hypothetical protein ABI462_11655 [Ignavibacteria bacterium]
MNLKYLFCIFLLIILRGTSYSQESLSSNINIIDRLIDESLTSLNNKFLILGKDNFYEVILDDGKPESTYLTESLRRKFFDYKLIFNEESDSIDYKLVISAPVFNVRYKRIFTDKILGTKKVEREVTVTYNVELTDKKNSAVVYNQNFDRKFKDSFDLDKLNFVEDRRYTFSHSGLPEENTLNQILFPAIIITASAAAIILFFIIRSK